MFIDLSKAFDIIDHATLLTEPEHYGIRGSCYNLLKSYPCNKMQYTMFQQVESENALLNMEYLKVLPWDHCYFSYT